MNNGMHVCETCGEKKNVESEFYKSSPNVCEACVIKRQIEYINRNKVDNQEPIIQKESRGPVNIKKKLCVRCGVAKPVWEFDDGVNSCRECSKVATEEYYQFLQKNNKGNGSATRGISR